MRISRPYEVTRTSLLAAGLIAPWHNQTQASSTVARFDPYDNRSGRQADPRRSDKGVSAEAQRGGAQR